MELQMAKECDLGGVVEASRAKVLDVCNHLATEIHVSEIR